MMLQGLIVVLSVLAASPRPAGAAASSVHVDVTGNGRPMILIPGFASSGRVWDALIKDFMTTDLREDVGKIAVPLLLVPAVNPTRERPGCPT